jgi:hypothetical protein
MGVSGQRHAQAALYLREKDPRQPLYRRLCGPQSRSGHRGYRKKKLLRLPGIEPRSYGRPVRSQTIHWLCYPGFQFKGYNSHILNQPVCLRTCNLSLQSLETWFLFTVCLLQFIVGTQKTRVLGLPPKKYPPEVFGGKFSENQRHGVMNTVCIDVMIYLLLLSNSWQNRGRMGSLHNPSFRSERC